MTSCKIFTIVCFILVSFHVRESQSTFFLLKKLFDAAFKPLFQNKVQTVIKAQNADIKKLDVPTVNPDNAPTKKPENVPTIKPNESINLQIKKPNKKLSDNKGIATKRPKKVESVVTSPPNHTKKIVIPNESSIEHNIKVDHVNEVITVIQPEWIDITLPSNDDFTLPSNAFNHPAFEQWFITQIQNIRSTRPSIFNLMDTYTLRLLLIKSLYKNGIRENNGKLYDLSGNYIDMAKLVLRPMYLGGSLDYEKLEVLIVTLVDSPKVLAIVPLRKILITESSNVIQQSGCNVCEFENFELSRTAEESNEGVESREALNEAENIDEDILVWRNDEPQVDSESSRSDDIVNYLDSGDYLDERTAQEVESEDLEGLSDRKGLNVISINTGKHKIHIKKTDAFGKEVIYAL